MELHPIYGPSAPEMGWVPAPRYLLRRDRILRLLDGLPLGHLLEIGCGASTLLFELKRLGFTCEALETSAPALEIARQINAIGVMFHQQPQEQWAGKFDYLLAFEVLEHIEDDCAALNTWNSWLKPGGRIVISVPAHMKKWTATDKWAGHYRRYEREDLKRLLTKAGFSLERFESYGYPLANLIAPLRARSHARQLVRRHIDKKDGRENNTAMSSIERTTETKLYPLLKSQLGQFVMRAAFCLQHLFINFDFGDGYIVLAKKTLQK